MNRDSVRWIRRMLRGGGAVLACGLASSGCGEFPNDQAGTLKRVRGGVMIVTLLEQRPWAASGGNGPEGVEVEAARALASELGAEIVWSEVTGNGAITAVAERHIDLLIGGITEDAVWKDQAAFTRPYLTYAVVVVGPAGTSIQGIDGRHVRVPPGSKVAKQIEQHGAIPAATRHQEQGAALEVRPAWRVGPGQTVITALTTERHVVAVPAGENAWLAYVDRYFAAREQQVRHRLRELAPP